MTTKIFFEKGRKNFRPCGANKNIVFYDKRRFIGTQMMCKVERLYFICLWRGMAGMGGKRV
jgi:hypothetical protein